ncbi:MAG: LamG-like jellyroll fold domain-containing protein, partial [Akkermansiaceae bacterium]
GSQLNQPEVSKALASILANPAQQITLLRSFENIEPKLAADPNLANLVGKASLEIFPKTAIENQLLIIRLATKFRIKSLEDPIRKWLASTKRSQSNTLSVITALREIGSSDRAFFEKHYRSLDPLIKREALISLAGLKDITLVAFIAQEWDSLPGDLRQVVIHGLTSTQKKAAALAKAAASKQFNDLTADSLGSLVSVLGVNHPDIKTIIKGSPGLLQPVINLTGDANDAIDQKITLKGSFTLESWIKLAPNISNLDSLLGAGKNKGADINFYDNTLRFYGGPGVGDLIVATRPMIPNLWTHCAITRDDQGRFKIYRDGVLDTDKSTPNKMDFANLEIGQSTAPGGSEFQIREFRV